MSNTITKAERYINNKEALDKIFAAKSYTTELEKPCQVVGADTVKIQSITFENKTLGDFDRINGYSAKDFKLEWITKKLSQDKGDSIFLDRMDDEEANVQGIATLHNKYVREIEVPEVDSYRFRTITATKDINSATGTLTKTTAADAIYDAYIAMEEAGVNLEGLILYVSPTIDGYLRKDAYAKGHVTIGTWNGQIGTEVRLFETAWIKVVPEAILGQGVNFILLHPSAVNAQKKYQEAVIFDQIAGHGKRLIEIDEGIYHDCWVEPNGEKGIYLHKSQADQAA